MTEQDAGMLIAELRAAYPRQNLPAESIFIYMRYLTQLERDEGKETIMELIATNDFLPSVQRIIDLTCEKRTGLPSPVSAWGLVSRRFGPSRAIGGDRSIELLPEIKEALAMAGIDAYRFWTAEDLQWIRKMFIESYSAIRGDIMKEEIKSLVRSVKEAQQHGIREADAVRALEDALELESGRVQGDDG